MEEPYLQDPHFCVVASGPKDGLSTFEELLSRAGGRVAISQTESRVLYSYDP